MAKGSKKTGESGGKAVRKEVQADSSETQEKAAEASKRNGVTRDRSNPPRYWCIGVNRVTGSMSKLWEEGTIGRARKADKRVREGFSSAYDQICWVRIKEVSLAEEE